MFKDVRAYCQGYSYCAHNAHIPPCIERVRALSNKINNNGVSGLNFKRSSTFFSIHFFCRFHTFCKKMPQALLIFLLIPSHSTLILSTPHSAVRRFHIIWVTRFMKRITRLALIKALVPPIYPWQDKFASLDPSSIFLTKNPRDHSISCASWFFKIRVVFHRSVSYIFS